MSEEWRLQNEIRAVEQIKRQFSAMLDDEPAILGDMVDSETNLFEMVDQCLIQIGELAGLVDSRKAMAKTILEGNDRYLARIGRIETMLEAVLDAIGERKLDTAVGTIGYRKKKRAVIVTDATVIPDEYLVFQEPRPDKRAIAEALADGEQVTGAFLSNQSESFQTRIK